MRPPLRVCLDHGNVRGSLSGVGYYALFLASALARRPAGHHRFLVFDGFRVQPLDPADVAQKEAASTAPGPAGRLARRLLEAGRRVPLARPVYRLLKTVAFARSDGAYDLLHALNYAPPGRTSKPCLPLVYDLSHRRFPEHHPGERVRWLERRETMIAAAPLINTISEFSAREIESVLGIERARIRVTYPGLNPAFAAPDRPEDAAILQTYGVKPGRYVLSVATLEPRKNLRTAVAAFAELPAEARGDGVLVLAGQPGWGRLDLPAGAAQLEEARAIRFTGYVPVDHLRILYRNTALFLYPSLYEGFGLPVAEAHLAGAPVAIGAGTATEEAASGLARILDPMDTVAWAEAVREALGGDAWRDRQARERRREAASVFDWDRNAEATVALYDEVARLTA